MTVALLGRPDPIVDGLEIPDLDEVLAALDFPTPELSLAPRMRQAASGLGAADPVVGPLGEYVDLVDRTIYTTDAKTVTSGRPTYVFLEGSQAGGALADPTTVVCSNGDSLTKISPIGAFGAFTNKSWVYGFIPTSGGSFTFTADWGASTLTQFCAKFFDITDLNTSSGIAGTYIIDSNKFEPTLPNAQSFSGSVQTAWNARNVSVLCGLVGSSGRFTSAGDGSPVKVGTDAGATGVATLGVYAKVGGVTSTIGMSWDGGVDVSSHYHYIEFLASSVTAPPLGAEIIGTPIHVTTGVSAQTYASISPVANDLLVLVVQHTGNPGALRTISSITGTLTATWTQVGADLDFDTIASPVQRMDVYIAKMGGTPGSGTVIANFSAATTGQHMVIIRIPGAAATGQIVQSPTNRGDAGTAVSAPLATFGHVNNGTLLFVGSDPTAIGAVLAGAGFEKLEQNTTAVAFANPASQLDIFWRHSNDTTPDATLPVTGDWCAFPMEVKAA